MTYAELKQRGTEFNEFLKANKIKSIFKCNHEASGIRFTSWTLEKKFKNGILELKLSKAKYGDLIDYTCDCIFHHKNGVNNIKFSIEKNRSKKQDNSVMFTLMSDAIYNAEAINEID
jgi:hypothetical protein